MTNQEKVENSNRIIIDCMTGADGGVQYVKFLTAIRHFAKDADDGNMDSKILLDIVYKFAKLIEVTNEVVYNG